MERRKFLRALILSSAALTSCATVKNDKELYPSKPNILFIFADDQCFSTLNSLGNKEVETPNLDRLIKSGVTFTHAYNMGAWHGAVCVASRLMLNTGRFVWHAKELDNKAAQQQEIDNGRFWSQMMGSAGYRTYMTGKWHVISDPTKVFDIVSNVRPGMPKQTEAGYNRPVEGQPDQWSPYDTERGGYWEGGKHWSEVVADDAEKYLTSALSDDKPFFMYLAFNAPHLIFIWIFWKKIFRDRNTFKRIFINIFFR